ncbi:MAG: molybdopterin-dependent oxidoreductase, partial [Gammaproteobacteria bacterium]|nr:molybdopterin-dependent oxidoreductase [Gammaproteobacteria bacterium]
MHAEPQLAAAAQERAGYVGQRMERLEDSALLSGRGAFADDLGVKAGTLHAAVLRSPHAHARLTGIRIDAALALKGVRAVLTGADVQRWAQPFVVGVKQPMQHWALAVDRVRHVGEPVAVVVAEDRYIAEDALDLIAVDYEPLPVVVEIARALQDDAPLLHDAVGSNVVSDRRFRYGDPEAAFAQARRVQTTVHFPRSSCSPIECGVVIAEHLGDAEGYDVLSNFMGPFSLHAVMAMALKVPGNKLRHRIPRDSGGSFGVKQAVFPYVVLMCLASRKAGAPVKWVEDRLEHLSAATSATARTTTIAAAVTDDGRILALEWDQAEDVGAYLRAPEPATFYRMHGALTGPYDIASVAVRNRVVVTNKTPTGLVRGFGGPQVFYALERLVDRISVELGIDAAVLRRRNFVRADQFPYRAAAGAVLDSGDYAQLLDMALAAAEGQGLRQRQAAARAAGRLYGIGMAAIVEPSVSNMGYISTVLTAEQRAKAGPKNGAIASATVAIDLLGGVNVTIASAPAGQGHMTVCAQVVADALGLKPADVMVNVEFDTAKDAWSVAAGNYSSRFAGAVAGTVHLAAIQLRDKLARIAAAQFGCEPGDVGFAEGQIFSTAEPAKRQAFTRLAASPHWAPGLLPAGVSPGLRETVFWTPETLTAPDPQDRVNTSAAYGFVVDICGLDVDPDTGAVRVDRYVTAHDAGRLLNPALADGQIRGAFAQGLGAALLEEFRYGADGSFQSGTLADYLMPTACETPDPLIVHLETPSPFTPLGAKGLGEGNNMSTPVCIANAFADALRPRRDIDDVRLPLTPSRVLDWLETPDPAPKSGPRPAAAPASRPGPAGGDGLTLQAQGAVEIAATPEQVFAVLLDPVALARVIPGCHALVADGPNRYRADVTVGVGLVKARYAASIELSEINAPRRLRLAGTGHSSLGTGGGDGVVTLEATAAGTTLHYDYRAQVGGKVAMVGSRMLEGAARIIVAQLFESLGRQAAGGAVTQPPWWRRLLQ